MYCLNCGRLISNREKFCPYCGFENKHYVNFENSNEDQEEIADENEKLHQDQDQEIIDDERIEKDESQQQALEHVQDTDYKNLEEISPDSTKDLVNENEYDSAFEIKENSIHDI
ncbi:MAG: zinc ribbon domain-containing protein, partial [Clostridiaceae bacterium]|nr:zinc ribbon domain-containing protein [Clostridiaceae bacterium]